jgi:hypothetical protein
MARAGRGPLAAVLAGAVASLGFRPAYQLTGRPRSGLALLATQLAIGWWALRHMGRR